MNVDNKYTEPVQRILRSGVVSIDRGGRVWRHYDGRHNVKRWLVRPREIRPRYRKGDPYPRVSLSGITVRVHKLVWLAFRGPLSNGLEVNHVNGIKSDCRLDNLEAVTTQGNSQHAHRTGLTRPARGEGVNTSKLTPVDVRKIRRLRAKGVSTRQIAAIYPVSYHNVWCIVTGRTWRHVA